MINILFGGNYKVFDGILLCLMSIIKHNKDPLNVYILSADVRELNPDYRPISEENRAFLNSILKHANPNSKVNLILLEDEFKNWIINSQNKLSVYTPYTFLRLFADKIAGLPEKIIYLDTDMMFNGNIKELFDVDISNYELGVVLDRYGHIFIHPKYFNAGMLLMNMRAIKESKLFERVKKMCLEKKMGFPDQTALNKCTRKKLYLPRKFNEQGNLHNDTIIQHFSKRIKWLPYFHTQNVKPWQIDKVHNIYHWHQYDDIYEKYTKIKQNSKSLIDK